ncbi:MAG: PleD family two-component system response regulator [Roseovarius sp.]
MKSSVEDNKRFKEKLGQSNEKRTKFRILVVDDELSILELVKTALETLESYHVEIASSAMDALEIVMDSEHPFDCMLLDIQMPGMDGIELLRQIRVLPEYKDTPTLMLTAMDDRQYIDLAFLEGASDYVNKPFDFLELRSRIKCAHGLVQARREVETAEHNANDTQKKDAADRQFNFDDPLSIEGAKSCLRYIEFDNYVAQLARRKLFGSQAISIMLHDAEMFYDLAGCGSFREAIHEMAYCIQRALTDFDCVFSYRGSGMFLLIIHGRKTSDFIISPESMSEYLGAQIRQNIDDDRIEVLVGKPVSLRVLSRNGAACALQKAMSAVQQLETELLKDDEYAKSFDVSDPMPEQSGGEKRIYERVLHELFGEESYLSTR